MKRLLLSGLSVAAILLSGCQNPSGTDPAEGYGADPKLPAAKSSILPTVNARPAVKWPAGAAPVAAEGLKVGRFAEGLSHPRWLYRLPNGDVLVAETNSPPREAKGIEAWVAKNMMKKAGAGVPSANRITLLRDADGDGVAETRSVFLSGLNSPSGMVLVGDAFYVANTDSVMRFTYSPGALKIEGAGQKIADLPAGTPNNHWARNIVASPDGTRLYVAVGSNSNIAEHGLEVEKDRAAILEFALDGSGRRIFASGLRNANGIDFEPVSGAMWTVVNERDMIGHDTPPDYMTSVRDGGFYGWPWSYWGQNADARVKPANPDMVAKAIRPDYGLGAHTASLGLHFYRGALLPEAWRGGVFVTQHGSWNRDPPSGYKVVYVPFAGGKPAGPAVDVLTGFLNDKAEAQGRPVGVIEDAAGALLVADDVGDIIWRVSPK